LNDIAKSCRELLTELEETIRQHGGVIPDSVGKTHKLGSMWKRLKWDPNHVRDLRDRISANVGIVNAMINILNSTASHIIRLNVEALLRSKDHEKWDALLEWLCPDTYTARQYANMRLRQPDTGRWFLDSSEFKTWVGCAPQTLFCPGIPGAGKTILASIVIDELQNRFRNNNRMGIAFVYCSFQHCDEQRVDELLACLLRQLIQGSADVPASVQSLYNNDGYFKIYSRNSCPLQRQARSEDYGNEAGRDEVLEWKIGQAAKFCGPECTTTGRNHHQNYRHCRRNVSTCFSQFLWNLTWT
jgi:hypothetical protein